eukprot:scaffold62146_cov23-Tisochrysis_lutea.AAC.2
MTIDYERKLKTVWAWLSNNGMHGLTNDSKGACHHALGRPWLRKLLSAEDEVLSRRYLLCARLLWQMQLLHAVATSRHVPLSLRGAPCTPGACHSHVDRCDKIRALAELFRELMRAHQEHIIPEWGTVAEIQGCNFVKYNAMEGF